MKRFASTDLFLEFSSSKYGSGVASGCFLAALFQYSDFDEFYFFYGDLLEKRYFIQQYQSFCESINQWKRIQLFPMHRFCEMAKTRPFDVLHRSDIHLSGIMDIRNQSATWFPVTGITHSISYFRQFQEYLNFMMVGAQNGDGIVCTTESAKKVVQNYLSRAAEILFQQVGKRFESKLQLEVIPLGIDESSIDLMNKKSARVKLNFDLESTYVFILGRFSPHSKYDLVPVIHEFFLVQQQVQTFKLVIAGDNSDSDYFNQISILVSNLNLANKIILKPNISGQEKNLLLNAVDIFFSPSDNIQETFGLTLVEAMAYGLPIVASDWNGYRNIVEDYQLGQLVPTQWIHDFDFVNQTVPIQFERDYHFFYAQNTVVDMESAFQKIIEISRQLPVERSIVREGYTKKYTWKDIIGQYLAFWARLKRQVEGKTLAACPLFNVDFTKVFSHYPSERMNRAELNLVLGKVGAAVLKNEIRITVYEELEELVDARIIQYLLERYKDCKPHAIESYCRVLVKKFDVSESDLDFTIAWMIKQNLLSSRLFSQMGQNTKKM